MSAIFDKNDDEFDIFETTIKLKRSRDGSKFHAAMGVVFEGAYVHLTGDGISVPETLLDLSLNALKRRII